MRLLKVGRDASCDIVLHSNKVSSLHAEITVLNNGDILLEDKNSHNGTFVMNKPIKPGTSISIRRGDAIRFADVELMWSQIPATEDNSKFKALHGIGTNFRNDLQISGNTVSRFHATLKIGKDGKAYIQDHSKNGTTVNGSRIPFGQNIQIKKNDSIVCGGVPVDVKRFLPRPSVFPKIAAAVAACCAVVVIALLPWKNIFNMSKPSDYISATTYVHGYYHYDVTLKGDPFIELFKGKGFTGWPEKYSFGTSEEGTVGLIDNETYSNIGYSGTAFFVSRDGKMITNRHVACPWEYQDYSTEISLTMNLLKESLIPEFTENNMISKLVNTDSPHCKMLLKLIMEGVITDYNQIAALVRQFKQSEIEIKGVSDYIAVGYAGHNYHSTDEFGRCTAISDSEDDKIDLAVIQLNSKETPSSVEKIVDLSRAITDSKSLRPLEETYYYIGYPLGTALNLKNLDGGLQPRLVDIKLAKTPGKYEIDLQGEVFGGASGSPILDSKGRLVGIVNKSYTSTAMSIGVLAKYAVNILNENN